ncbi:head decoration protein [Paraburkholderia sp. D15]|uniref:head decoration protein n=1 Tax=Paraburkholderia sp. D15 TaxID=2880218 RepID=UPI0024795742|nr:head decoration protein [Paraburkholderia sp. D15]WGS50844.1 head decoration protein [Paraburkholderia sp. D15]
MNSIKTQGSVTGEFLLSEGPGRISREQILVARGDALPAGQLLGTTGTGEYAPYNNAATDGSEVVTAILYGPLAASDEPRAAVGIVRLAEVAAQLLAGLDAAARTDLAAHYVIVR